MNIENTRTQQLKGADIPLWRQIKAAAAIDGLTLTQWVEKVAREKLDKNTK